MNKLPILTLLICFLFTSFTIPQEEAGNITIEVEGLRNNKGMVRIGIYNKAKDYLEESAVIKSLTGKIENNKCIVQTGKLPYGDYAFALLHDENNNNKMDYNWMKIPQEGFGFSKNPKIKFSAPSFDETKVSLDKPEKKITITAKYM